MSVGARFTVCTKYFSICAIFLLMTGDLMRVLSGPATPLVGMGTLRKDYYLFSTYEVNLPGEEHLYMGILDHFIRLRK